MIEQKISRFWWKSSNNRSGIHWMKWEALKNRKDEGGLGFRDLITFNQALLGKQAWRLSQQPLSLSSRVLKGLYFPFQEFWNASKGARPLWAWQSILIGRDSIVEHMQRSVGDGTHIKIRQDRWLASGIIGGPTPRGESKTVTNLMVQNNNEWNTPPKTKF